MQKIEVSKHSIRVIRPKYMKENYPSVIGLYDPINSILLSFIDEELSENEIKYIDSSYHIEHTLTNCEVYVKLTEGCNFACPGCVTSSDLINPKDARILSIATLRYLLKNCYRSANEKHFKTIKIKWAGGEPLLTSSYNLICEIQDTLKKLSSKYEINTTQVVLTNGVFLNEDKINFLQKHNIQLSISLWGTRLIQDSERKPRNGQESFDTIARNICMVAKSKINYSVNHVITPANAHHFKEFIECMWDVNSKSFIGKPYGIKTPIPLYFAIYRPQSSTHNWIKMKIYKKIEEGINEGFKVIYKLIEDGLQVQPLVRFDYLNYSGVSLTTCGTGFSYIAIGPDGVTNCHECLFDMKENLNSLNNANVFDLAFEQLDLKEDDLISLNHSENKLLSLHGGLGCPRLRNDIGNGDEISNLYLNLTNGLLALEILRDSKMFIPKKRD